MTYKSKGHKESTKDAPRATEKIGDSETHELQVLIQISKQEVGIDIRPM